MITLDQALEQIQRINPFFGSFFRSKELFGDYCQKLTKHKCSDIHKERQQPYLKLIKQKTDQLFAKEDVKLNIDEGMVLDTTAHHNVLNYPTIIGAHLTSRFDTIFNRQELGDYYVLDCGNISFSEVLHKRGVEYAGRHINLYPKKDKNKLASRYPIYKFDLMDWVKKSGHSFNNSELDFIRYFQGIIDSVDLSTCSRFSDQIVKINHLMWLEFFPESARDKVRHCITLEHDEILINFLKMFLLEDKDNIIWRTLFDKEFQGVVLKEFNQVYGAWDYSGKNTGTYFFWGFCKDDGKEYRYELQGDTLVEPGNRVRSVKLEPADVVKALDEGVLVPSIFTKFSLIISYFGAKVMGGPGQTDYIGKIQNAWLKVLKQFDQKELKLAENINSLNVNTFDLAYTRDKNGKVFREWGFDIARSHRFSSEYLDNLKQAELGHLIYPVIPISYYRLTPAEERQEVDYNDNDLFRGLDWIK